MSQLLWAVCPASNGLPLRSFLRISWKDCAQKVTLKRRRFNAVLKGLNVEACRL